MINPNTSARTTERLRQALENVKGQETELVAVNPSEGPAAIESDADEALAIPPLLELVIAGARTGCQASIIACFADPGLATARGLVTIPVLRIEETTLHMAVMLGGRFSILTPRRDRVPNKLQDVKALGLEKWLASVCPLEMGVLEMEDQPDRTWARLVEVTERAVSEDGAEIIILGCAGLAGFADDLQTRFGVTVLDPAAVTLKVAEAYVKLGTRPTPAGLRQ